MRKGFDTKIYGRIWTQKRAKRSKERLKKTATPWQKKSRFYEGGLRPERNLESDRWSEPGFFYFAPARIFLYKKRTTVRSTEPGSTVIKRRRKTSSKTKGKPEKRIPRRRRTMKTERNKRNTKKQTLFERVTPKKRKRQSKKRGVQRTQALPQIVRVVPQPRVPVLNR